MTTISPPSAPTTETVTIAARFQGPPGMGNGGYVAGLLGGAGPARVILRRPVPLERPLTMVSGGDATTLRDGAQLLAELHTGTTPDTLEDPGNLGAIERLPALAKVNEHPFPHCFVCGPLNPEGLRLAFKAVGDGVGASFIPPVAPSGDIPVEYLVGALDCTSGWSTYVAGEAGVLGTIEYALSARPAPGERLVVIGHGESIDGQKRRARSSLYDSAGRVLGSAKATWIDIALPAPVSEGSRTHA